MGFLDRTEDCRTGQQLRPTRSRRRGGARKGTRTGSVGASAKATAGMREPPTMVAAIKGATAGYRRRCENRARSMASIRIRLTRRSSTLAAMVPSIAGGKSLGGLSFWSCFGFSRGRDVSTTTGKLGKSGMRYGLVVDDFAANPGGEWEVFSGAPVSEPAGAGFPLETLRHILFRATL